MNYGLKRSNLFFHILCAVLLSVQEKFCDSFLKCCVLHSLARLSNKICTESKLAFSQNSSLEVTGSFKTIKLLVSLFWGAEYSQNAWRILKSLPNVWLMHTFGLILDQGRSRLFKTGSSNHIGDPEIWVGKIWINLLEAQENEKSLACQRKHNENFRFFSDLQLWPIVVF